MSADRSSSFTFTVVPSMIVLAALLFGGPPRIAHAASLGGPVIIGGDDLALRGSRVGGVNQGGWVYLEKAIAAINAGVTASGPFTVDIAALGPMPVPGCPGSCPDGDDNPALGIGSVAEDLGLTVSFHGDAAQGAQFFADLASGAVKPRIIWLAGCNLIRNALCVPDFYGESQVLLENAAALSGFVASGHGLMAHGARNLSPPLTWLQSLLPDVGVTYRQCDSNGAGLTAEGMSVLPGVSDSDIDSNAAECHNQFTISAAGGYRDLRILALEGAGVAPDSAVCVGGSDEGLSCPTASNCPGGTCEPGGTYIIGGGTGTLLTGCGDDAVNYGEECDGADDSACPGACLPPGDALECRCNRCDVPLTGCKLPTQAQKAQLSIKDKVDDAKDKLQWKWVKGAATTKSEFEDQFGNTPLEDDGPLYQLCVFADAVDDPTPIARASVRADALLPTSCNLLSSK
jgi:hypothetical protein